MAGDGQVVQIQQSWSRVMLALLIGVPAMGYVFYYMRKHKPKPDSVDGQDSKRKTEKTDSIEKAEIPAELTPETPLQKALKLKEDGNIMYKAKKFPEAIRCYSEAIELCPASEKEYLLSALYQNRAAAYESLDDLEAVISNCTEAIKIKPTYLKALLRRYKACEKLGNLRMAMEDVTACCILQQFSSTEELQNADRILKSLGLEEAEKYMKVKPAVIPSSEFIKHYFNSFSNDPISKYLTSTENGAQEEGEATGLVAAKKAMRNADYENVIPLCSNEINLVKQNNSEPNDAYYEALLLRGTMHLLSSQDVLARADLTEIVEASSVDPKVAVSALLKRAGLFMQDVQMAKAHEDYQTAIRIDPGNSDIYHQMAQMLLLDDKTEEALEQFEKAYTLNPKATIVLTQKLYAEYKLAMKNKNKVKADSAKLRLDEVVSQNPKVTEGFLLLAQIYNENDEYQKAEDVINRAIKADPRNATILVHKGLLRLQWKADVDGSIEEMERAIKLDPKCEFAYETLASVEVQRGNLLKAIPLFEKALPLTKCLREAAHIISLKAAAQAQYTVSSSLGVSFQL
uniref:Mitochondrial import receptor subunit TOM70 n=4 Tax=Lygus hesperus TaxID=30085 RepID=A0A0A9XTA0_LYGHE